MEQIKGKYIILNGKAVEQSGNSSAFSTAPYYEVIRVIDGKLLFVGDHFSRLYSSAGSACLSLPKREQLLSDLHELIRLNAFPEGNIKMLAFQGEGKKCNLVSYFIPHSYPPPELYKTGVDVRTFRHTRPDPAIKKWDDLFRTRVAEFIHSEAIFEAILTDEDGYMTEGSRSNLFFTTKDDTIVSTPERASLRGITRIKLEEICKAEGIRLEYRKVNEESAAGFRGCFLTGTSPKIMPVRRMNMLSYDPDDALIRELMLLYDRKISSYLDHYPPF